MTAACSRLADDVSKPKQMNDTTVPLSKCFRLSAAQFLCGSSADPARHRSRLKSGELTDGFCGQSTYVTQGAVYRFGVSV